MRLNIVLPVVLCVAANAACIQAWAAPAGYSIIDGASAFRGRVTYVAQRTDELSPPRVAGTLTIGHSIWSVDERTPTTIAIASSKGGSLQGGGLSTGVDDPLAAGSVANAWAVAMGTLSMSAAARSTDGGAIWRSADLRLYLDDARDRVDGLADTAGAGDVSFAFDDWVDVAGVRLPERVMRLRNGVPEASYAISGYAVLREPALSALPAALRAKKTAGDVGSPATVAAQPAAGGSIIDFPWRLFFSAFGALLFAICIVAWTRRDALIEALRRRVEADPRGWEARGVSAFVSPEGRLWFDGAEYVVGAQFYGRQAAVQTSPLFLRVGAREVPRVVILARKFRSPEWLKRLQPSRSARRTSAGLSLIENIVAISVFSAVVVGAVYPTLVVMANGDRLARTQSNAVRLAANALSDEEAACAYGDVPTGSVQTQAGGLTVIVTVAASLTGVAGAHDIDVAVNDSSGRTLAHAISTVGPAVQAPPPPGQTPTPLPVPSPGPSG